MTWVLLAGWLLLTTALPVDNDKDFRLEEDEDWVIDNGPVIAWATNSFRITTHDVLSEQALGAAPKLVADNVLSQTGLTVRPLVHTSRLEALAMGTRYNDMPSDREEEATCSETSTLPAFGYKFFMQHADSVTGQSHHGCRQTWHSMCPVAETQPYSFTMSDVRAIIFGDIERWWNRAVAMYTISEHNCAMFNLGRVLHTIQDSYAPGHVVRAETAQGANCGKILHFQGYGAEDHGKHGAADDWTKSSDSMMPYICARRASTEITKQWFLCTTYIDLKRGSATPELGEAFKKFAQVYGNPCLMYREFPQNWAPPALPPPGTDLFAQLYLLFAFEDSVKDEHNRPFNVGASRAGGALDAFYSSDHPGRTYVPTKLTYTGARGPTTVTIFMDDTPGPAYNPSAAICGSVYRTIPESMLHVVGRTGAAIGHGALKLVKSTIDAVLD